MKQKIKNELLAYAVIDIVKKAFKVILLMSAGAAIGYAFANKECEQCPVGFATVEDMMFLVAELRVCKRY